MPLQHPAANYYTLLFANGKIPINKEVTVFFGKGIL